MTIYEPADWRPEPGDVAEVTHQFRTEDAAFGTDKKWHSISPGNIGALLVNPSRARHLARVDPASTVILDPESADDLDRICDAMRKRGWDAIDDDAQSDMRNVLRDLLPSPTPPEPNGLGAVVDADYIGRMVRTVHGWIGPDGERYDYALAKNRNIRSHGVGCSCGAPDCNGGDQ